MADLENKRDSFKQSQNCQDDELPPEDKFYFVRVTILLVGMTGLLTSSFYSSAYDYWMYKFRDPAMGPVYNASNRTTLQVNFTTGLPIALAVPSLFGLTFAVTYAQKFKSRLKVYVCYGILIFSYTLTTLFVLVDTDSWQMAFFVITLMLLGIKSLIFCVLLTTMIVLVPKLPPIYLKWLLLGQGSAGIFSVILQINCLAIGNDSQTTGLIYFASGTFLFIITISMYHFTQYTALFERYINDKKETTTMVFPKWIVIKEAVLTIWPVLLIQALVVLSSSTTNFVNLIVSESYGDGSDWTQKYFVPVITIFYGDVVGVIGRIFASAILTVKTAKWFLIVALLRVIIFTPLFIFCNVRTTGRGVEPWFPYDWQYMIILGVFVFTHGYYNAGCALSVRNFVKEGEPLDLYFLLLTVILSTCGLLFSPISIVIVNLL